MKGSAVRRQLRSVIPAKELQRKQRAAALEAQRKEAAELQRQRYKKQKAEEQKRLPKQFSAMDASFKEAEKEAKENIIRKNLTPRLTDFLFPDEIQHYTKKVEELRNISLKVQAGKLLYADKIALRNKVGELKKERKTLQFKYNTTNLPTVHFKEGRLWFKFPERVSD